MHSRLTTTFCLILLSIWFSSAVAQRKPTRDFMELWANVEAEKFEQLIASCQDNETDPIAQAILGVVHAKTPDFENAETHSSRAVELAPKNPNVLSCRAYVLGAQGRYEEGIEFCNQAIKQDANHAFAKTHLSNLLYFNGQIDESEKVIDEVLESDESLALSWYVKANLEQLFFRTEQSVECQRKAIEINPKYLNAHVMQGYSYLADMKYDIALEKADEIIELNPTSYLGYEFRAYALTLKLQEISDQALADTEKTIDLNPNHYSVYASKADVLMLVEEYDEALKSVDRSIELHPRPFYANLLRSSVLAKLERFDEAFTAIDRAAELVPNHFRTHYLRGYVHLWTGDNKKAIEEFDQAQRLCPGYPSIYTARSRCHDEPEKAISEMDKAIELAPHVSWFYRERANLYDEIGAEDLANYDRRRADKLDKPGNR